MTYLMSMTNPTEITPKMHQRNSPYPDDEEIGRKCLVHS